MNSMMLWQRKLIGFWIASRRTLTEEIKKSLCHATQCLPDHTVFSFGPYHTKICEQTGEDLEKVQKDEDGTGKHDMCRKNEKIEFVHPQDNKA